MSIFHLEDLSAQRQIVAEIIIDVVVHNSSPGTYKFTLQDLYNQSERVQAQSEAQNIKASIRRIVYELRGYELLKNDEEVRGGFELTKGRLLFYLVREKRLQEEIEKATRALEKAKQELNGMNSE